MRNLPDVFHVMTYKAGVTLNHVVLIIFVAGKSRHYGARLKPSDPYATYEAVCDGMTCTRDRCDGADAYAGLAAMSGD